MLLTSYKNHLLVTSQPCSFDIRWRAHPKFAQRLLGKENYIQAAGRFVLKTLPEIKIKNKRDFIINK
jgi:hypothetical protein